MTVSENGQIACDLVALIGIGFFVGLRLWVTYYLRRKNHTRLIANEVGDAFLVLAFLLCVSIIGMDTWLMIQKRDARLAGEPVVPGVEVPERLVENYLKFTYYYVIAYISILWLAKASLLCSYHVVASRLSGPIAMAVKIAIVTTAVSYPICTFAHLFWCRPMSRFWTLSGPESCIVYSMLDLVLVYSIQHLVTDVIVIVTGIAVVRSLALGKPERIASVFMLLLGTLMLATAVARLAVQMQLLQKTRDGDYATMARNIKEIYLAGVAEVCGAMIAVCLPALRVFLRKTKSRVRQAPRSSRELEGELEIGERRDKITITTYVSIESGSTAGLQQKSHCPDKELELNRFSQPWQHR